MQRVRLPFEHMSSNSQAAAFQKGVGLAEQGFTIGFGTRLIRFPSGHHCASDPNKDRDRCLALLSVLGRQPMAADVLLPLATAERHWRRGEKAIANLRLVFADLPVIDCYADAVRLQAAEYLLDNGFEPDELMKELGLDPSILWFDKYDVEQPRVPAGNGPESGRWARAHSHSSPTTSPTRSNIVLAADQKTPGGVTLDDKIRKQMKSRGFSPEQIDEAVQVGPRIDATNKATGGPAVRYVNPSTGQSVVIDSTTNQVIQVGRPDFQFGTESGDVPGAAMRPAPTAPTNPAVSSPIVEEPVIVPDVIIPP